MYKHPRHITSSYNINDIGKSIYVIVIESKPNIIIDFGILYGYSTVCMAQAVKDNGFGEVFAYDLFEEYKYNNSIKDIVLHNLKYFNLEDYVTFKKINFYDWIDNGNESFDLLHLDISNDADILLSLYNKYPNSKVIFEGGTGERDEVNWMIKYNRNKITSIKDEINYKVIDKNFPGLSGYNI